MSDKFQLVRRGVDKSRIYTPTVAALVAVEDTDLCLLAGGQIGPVITKAADIALIDAAADGVVLTVDFTFYKLKDVSAGAVAGNILFESSSSVTIHKVGGEVYWNNATPGPFNPNAFVVSAITNPLALSETPIITF